MKKFKYWMISLKQINGETMLVVGHVNSFYKVYFFKLTRNGLELAGRTPNFPQYIIKFLNGIGFTGYTKDGKQYDFYTNELVGSL